MASTFLHLTNRLLRKVNEVEIPEADFSNTRGVQTLAKDAIIDSISQINQQRFEWPFNAALHTQQLAVGQEEYSFPEFFKIADWTSFQIQKNDSLGVSHKNLRFIDRDEYTARFKDTDDDSGASGVSCPDFVFPSHGNGYGVSRSPDQAYSLQFKYFMTQSALADYTDVSRIPTPYDNVILDGALFYLYMYRGNAESAGIISQVFRNGLKSMQHILLPDFDQLHDTRVRR
tara:strand:- start:4760 stop:5449 length:690 start_codon:yes stop_codon:yes gene_type:complete